MEDKLFVLTVHQLQGYSKGTPNISHCEAGWPRTHSTLARQFNYTSARDAQSLDGQYSHIATLFDMKAHPTMPSARDTQTLAGQPGQGHTVPCRPVLTATLFTMKAYYTHAFLVKDPTLTIHLVRDLMLTSAPSTRSRTLC